MIPRRLPNSAATSLLELADVASDAQRGRAAAEHLDDGVDLLVVVHAPGVLDAPYRPLSARSRRAAPAPLAASGDRCASVLALAGRVECGAHAVCFSSTGR